MNCMNRFCRVFIPLVLIASAVPAFAGRRTFIGIDMGYRQAESYQAQKDTRLVFYDNFNDNTVHPAWQRHGAIPFYEDNRQLKARMRTRKRKFMSGIMICQKIGNLSALPLRLSIEHSLPNRNHSITSSIVLFPHYCAFDNTGHPLEYIRYFKKSQMEYLETKDAHGKSRLLWGRNQPVVPGKSRQVQIVLDKKTITLHVDGKTLFSGEHHYQGLSKVRSGFWVSTSGVSFAGGHQTFDNFTLESLIVD